MDPSCGGNWARRSAANTSLSPTRQAMRTRTPKPLKRQVKKLGREPLKRAPRRRRRSPRFGGYLRDSLRDDVLRDPGGVAELAEHQGRVSFAVGHYLGLDVRMDRSFVRGHEARALVRCRRPQCQARNQPGSGSSTSRGDDRDVEDLRCGVFTATINCAAWLSCDRFTLVMCAPLSRPSRTAPCTGSKVETKGPLIVEAEGLLRSYVRRATEPQL